MPSRKKTRTTSSDIYSSRAAGKLRHTRQQVAAEAARIMATEGQHNYLAAKQKAAERLGISNSLALPSNIEVEEALRIYQSLYGGEKHVEYLQKLRMAAIDAMQYLEQFSPRLVGPVLDGTADQHSRVALHLFCDPPDAVAIFLMDKGLPFRHEQRRIRWHDNSYRTIPMIVTEVGNMTMELSLFEQVDIRQSPPSPVSGKPQKRATLAEVEMLLSEAELETSSPVML